MSNEDVRKICLSLAQADTENEVTEILKKAGYWNNKSSWGDYSGNENNFSSIGNQQSLPEVALVEKIINSIDAVLMRECLRLGINPQGREAPQSMEEALQKFFNIFGGKLSNLDPRERASIAKNILLVATGLRSNPSYSVIDFGEGQSPKRMPDTFLSLQKSNKLRIPFVQGKFNMGGTGAFLFCGKSGGDNLQLIISRRDQKVAAEEKDETNGKWGFTVIRRFDPQEGRRSSVFKYLAPGGKILMFDAPKGLPLVPSEYPNPLGNLLPSGTYLKLYEYQLTPALKTIIKFDLYYRLSLLTPNIALPIQLVERRKGYTANNYEAVLSGLNVRLEEDRGNNLENGFPSSSEVNVQGQVMKVLVYAFKDGKKANYAPKEGVTFTINGQAHGFIPKTFYDRKSVGMQYLSDSILLIADCSSFSGRTREDLFMNSRDRLRECPLKNEIEKELESIVKNHQGLRDLRERRRREEIENRLQDSKPLAEAIESIIKKSPSLSKLFIQGVRILNPFRAESTIGETKFEPKRFPTYFKLSKEYPIDRQKLCPINKRFRVQFLTDASNDYFNRDTDSGEFIIKVKEDVIENFSINLWNGIATLTVELPEDAEVDNIYAYHVEVTDSHRLEPFETSFHIKVAEAEEKVTGGTGRRKRDGKKEQGQNRLDTSSYLDLPNIIEVKREDWEKRKMNEKTALIVKDSGDSGYDFYINLDNVYLRTEVKDGHKTDPRLLEARFKYGMVLIGLSLLDFYDKSDQKKEQPDNQSRFDTITDFTTAISSVLLPIIASLSELDI